MYNVHVELNRITHNKKLIVPVHEWMFNYETTWLSMEIKKYGGVKCLTNWFFTSNTNEIYVIMTYIIILL